MTTVISTLKPSAISEELNNTEVELIDGLFGVKNYKSGTVIAQTEDRSILALGSIKVKVKSSVGESTIQILKPGDIFKLGDLAGMPDSDNGSVSQIPTTLYAVGDTKVLSLDQIWFENTCKFQSENLQCVMQGMARSVYDILQIMKYQYVELRNYFYRINGLY